MIAHRRDEHSVNDIFRCRHCGKEFRNAKFCKNHERRHEAEGGTNGLPLEAEFMCEFPVPNPDDGDTHVTCGRRFSSRHNLDRHVRSHTGQKSHACDLCSKTFVDSTRLRRHKWIHIGHAPYKCGDCDAGFRHLSHLKNHEASVHGKEKPFECEVCSKRFVYPYQLKAHLASAHGPGGKCFHSIYPYVFVTC